MLTYTFNTKSNIPLYEQLYKLLRTDIASGALAGGTRLPSRRSFAANLGVSTITVENAYAQLVAEGYIYTLPKKGYFVSEIGPTTAEIYDIQDEPPEILLPVEEKEAPFIPLTADFTSNQTANDIFPFSIWSRLIREVLSDSRYDLLTNSPPGGVLELRQAIAEHLHDFYGMRISPDQVIIGAGTEYLYGILIQLLGFDLRYGVEDPGYRKISRIYQSHHVKCSFIPMDHHGVRLDDLENEQVDVIHISPSHQFPTGITMPAARRYALLKWAAGKEDRWIIEDDYDSEFRLTGQPIPPLMSIDNRDKVIYINTFTKTLSSTVRISYMVLPPCLVERYYRKLSFYSCTVSTFEQYTLAAFISKGYFEKHINRARNDYRARRNALLETIRLSPLAPYVTVSGEDAGLHFLMTVGTGLSDDAFRKKAKEKGILLNALSGYYQSPPDDLRHIFVINYTSVGADAVEPAIIALSDIVCGQKRG